MQSCLRQQAKIPLQRRHDVRTTVGRRIAATLNSHSAAMRIYGSRFNSLWSEQGVQTEKMLDHKGKTNSSTKKPARVAKESTMGVPSPHLKSSGKVPPEGVKTLQPPTNTLPEKPSRPPYPCPHLSDAEVETYLLPLYERGWGIFTKTPSKVKDEPSVPTLMLAKDLTFVWHSTLLDFLTTLNVLVKQERHHPRVAYEFRSLELRMQTHEATLDDPQEREQPPKALPTVTPGITLRDIRLAYLIEEALRPYYELDKIAVPTSPPLSQPSSIREIGLMMKEYAAETKADAKERATKCIVCGGDHWATQCPKRFTVQPMVPCDLCGGAHWRFTCLLYKDWKAKVKNGGGPKGVQQMGEI